MSGNEKKIISSLRGTLGIIRSPLFLLVVGFLFLGFFFSRTSVFRVSEFGVKVADPTLHDLVMQKLVPHLGRSLLSVPVTELEDDLLQIPKVEKVRIIRNWPNSLAVEIDLIPPVGYVAVGKNFYSVDREANILERIESARDLPLFTGLFDSKSKGLLIPRELAAEICNWISSTLNKNNLKSIDVAQIRHIEWTSAKGLTLFWGGEAGLEIVLGFFGWEEAWARVQRLWALENFKPSQLVQIDASYATRVVAKKRRELRKPDNGLNLEELVRRGEGEIELQAR